MSPETVRVKLAVNADEEVAVTLSAEVSCTQTPCSAYLNPAHPSCRLAVTPHNAAQQGAGWCG